MALTFPDAQRTTLLGLNGYRNFAGLSAVARPCPEDPTQPHCIPQKSSADDLAYAQARQNALGPPPPAGSSPDRIAAYEQRKAAFDAANKRVCRRTGIGFNTTETCKTQAEWDALAGRRTQIGIPQGAGRTPAGGGGGGYSSAGGGAAGGAAGGAVVDGGGMIYQDAPLPADAPSAGMSTGMMVALGLGVLAVIGGGAYLVLAK